MRGRSKVGASRTDVRTFPDWEGKPVDELLYQCRELVEDPSFPTVRRWRENGGKVLGHFQVYFPEEIAHAAGLLPFKLRGAPLEPTRADSHFGSYLCSIVKSTLEVALSEHARVDLFVTHPICDAARNLAGVWGRNFDFPCQILYLPQNPNSRHASSWLRGEYDRLARTVAEVAGRSPDAESLRGSIAIYNENRALLRRLYDLKRERPWQVAAEDAYALMAIGGMMPREEHNQVLGAALPMLEERAVRVQDRIRVVFEGGFCEQPPLDLVRTIGQSCYVVDDDFLIGLRWLVADLDPCDDPLQALADGYLERSSYSPVQHDLRKPKEKMLLERIARARAQAAIVTAAKMCEPGLEEQVAYTHALDRAGIPYFVSEFEENMTSFETLAVQLETFVENLMFD
jgi:benzoyl-CoA reductase subunit C